MNQITGTGWKSAPAFCNVSRAPTPICDSASLIMSFCVFVRGLSANIIPIKHEDPVRFGYLGSTWSLECPSTSLVMICRASLHERYVGIPLPNRYITLISTRCVASMFRKTRETLCRATCQGMRLHQIIHRRPLCSRAPLLQLYRTTYLQTIPLPSIARELQSTQDPVPQARPTFRLVHLDNQQESTFCPKPALLRHNSTHHCHHPLEKQAPEDSPQRTS